VSLRQLTEQRPAYLLVPGLNLGPENGFFGLIFLVASLNPAPHIVRCLTNRPVRFPSTSFPHLHPVIRTVGKKTTHEVVLNNPTKVT